MTRVQNQTFHPLVPSFLFLGMAYFAGSKRFIQYFPKASREGLLLTAAWGSGAIYANKNWMREKPSFLEKSLRLTATLALSALCASCVARSLKGRVQLSIKSALKFTLLEGGVAVGLTPASDTREPPIHQDASTQTQLQSQESDASLPTYKHSSTQTEKLELQASPPQIQEWGNVPEDHPLSPEKTVREWHTYFQQHSAACETLSNEDRPEYVQQFDNEDFELLNLEEFESAKTITPVAIKALDDACMYCPEPLQTLSSDVIPSLYALFQEIPNAPHLEDLLRRLHPNCILNLSKEEAQLVSQTLTTKTFNSLFYARQIAYNTTFFREELNTIPILRLTIDHWGACVAYPESLHWVHAQFQKMPVTFDLLLPETRRQFTMLFDFYGFSKMPDTRNDGSANTLRLSKEGALHFQTPKTPLSSPLKAKAPPPNVNKKNTSSPQKKDKTPSPQKAPSTPLLPHNLNLFNFPIAQLHAR